MFYTINNRVLQGSAILGNVNKVQNGDVIHLKMDVIHLKMVMLLKMIPGISIAFHVKEKGNNGLHN